MTHAKATNHSKSADHAITFLGQGFAVRHACVTWKPLGSREEERHACDIVLGQCGVVGQVEGEGSVVARNHVPGRSAEEELPIDLGCLCVVQNSGSGPCW